VSDADACLGATATGRTTGEAEARLCAPVGHDRGAEPDADAALVDACVNRSDQTAFATLVARHQDYVFRLALSVLGPEGEGDAQDVTQDVFIRVAGHLRDFRGESAFRTWLRRLALNLALDRRRRARWRKPHVNASVLDERPTTDAADDPFSSAESAERVRAVGQCLEVLSAATRTVIHLHYWLDHSVDEIASMLSMPSGSVKSHLHRGRRLLYQTMKARGLS
jgi:RNA polymerase sigma-70 factor, ECF subfamily